MLGIEEGWKGMIAGRPLPGYRRELLRGGTAIGTSRTNPFKKEGGADAVLATFKKLKLEALIAMGGEDTLGVAARLFREHASHVVGVPKTMDNDLSATDFTFGFDTAVTVAMDACARLLDTGRSHRRCMVLEVMGRMPLRPTPARLGRLRAPSEGDVKAARWSRPTRKKVALVVAPRPWRSRAGEAAEARRVRPHDPPESARRRADRRDHRGGDEHRDPPRHHRPCPTRRHPTLRLHLATLASGPPSSDEKRWGQMVALRGNDMVPVSIEEATAKLKTVTPEWFSILDTLCRTPGREAVKPA